MTERTLIPMDGSPFGEAALHYMEDFVEKLNPGEKPEITLLEVVNPRVRHVNVEGGYVDVVDRSDEIEREQAEAAAYLEKAGEILRREGAIVQSRVMVNERLSDISESILDAEKETHADLVAMSAHDRRFLARWTHHNIAEKVSRKGDVPVLMVRVREKA